MFKELCDSIAKALVVTNDSKIFVFNVFLFTLLLLVFPNLAQVACFPVHGTGFRFSRAWQRFHIFLCLAMVPCFRALDIGCIFSRASHRFHVFPALGTGCPFSRALLCFQAFLRLTPIACFLALGTGCLFSRAWHRFHVFCIWLLTLTPVTSYSFTSILVCCK